MAGYTARGPHAALCIALWFRPCRKGIDRYHRLPFRRLARDRGRGHEPGSGSDLGMAPREIGGSTQGQEHAEDQHAYGRKGEEFHRHSGRLSGCSSGCSSGEFFRETPYRTPPSGTVRCKGSEIAKPMPRKQGGHRNAGIAANHLKKLDNSS